MKNLARNVDKEEKTYVELIIRAHLLERITQVANTGRGKRARDGTSPAAYFTLRRWYDKDTMVIPSFLHFKVPEQVRRKMATTTA
jgi:hypothetical protein